MGPPPAQLLSSDSLKTDQEFINITKDKLLELVGRAAQYGTKEECLNIITKTPNKTRPGPGNINHIRQTHAQHLTARAGSF